MHNPTSKAAADLSLVPRHTVRVLAAYAAITEQSGVAATRAIEAGASAKVWIS